MVCARVQYGIAIFGLWRCFVGGRPKSALFGAALGASSNGHIHLRQVRDGGHPDKIADQVSDAIDALLEQDPRIGSRVDAHQDGLR